MLNLKSAKEAIQAELEHARQGVTYYQSRVEALEEALSKVESVDTPAPGGRGRRGTKIEEPELPVKEAKPGRRGRGRPAGSTNSGGDDDKLPSTGKNFWPDLITSQPRSAPEILKAAIEALGLSSPSKAQTKKLSQRQASALSILTKSGVVQSSGSGRERRFFKRH